MVSEIRLEKQRLFSWHLGDENEEMQSEYFREPNPAIVTIGLAITEAREK